MKKLIFVFLTIFLVLIPTAAVHAASDDYVIDQEGLLSDEETARLNERAAEAVQEYGIGIYIRYYEDYDTDDIESYAEEIYQNEDLGIGDEKDGVLLIVTMADRSYDIAAYGNTANACFTDYGKEQLADAFLPYLSDGDYAEAADVFIEEASSYMDEAENGSGPVDTWIPEEPEESYQMSAGAKAAIIIAIPCIISFLICFAIARLNKTSRTAARADAYIPENGMRITGRQDVFLYQTRSVTHIPRNDPPSGGSMGGTSVNSSGFSHSSGHF